MIWVLLVAALLLGLLAIPVRGEVLWRNQSPPQVKLRWLFLTFRVFPRPAKRRMPEKNAPHPAAKPAKPQAKPGPAQLELLVDLLASVKGAAGFLLRRFRLYRVRLDLIVAKGDAAKTAIAYGRANAMVYGAYATAKNFLNLGKPDIHIHPNFTADQGDATLEVRGRLSPLAALGAAIWGGGSFLARCLRRSRANQSET